MTHFGIPIKETQNLASDSFKKAFLTFINKIDAQQADYIFMAAQFRHNLQLRHEASLVAGIPDFIDSFHGNGYSVFTFPFSRRSTFSMTDFSIWFLGKPFKDCSEFPFSKLFWSCAGSRKLLKFRVSLNIQVKSSKRTDFDIIQRAFDPREIAPTTNRSIAIRQQR